MTCRICDSLTVEVLDLGRMPPANSLKENPDDPETLYGLTLEWCRTCDNVQLRETLGIDELYRNYMYITPPSSMLTAHYAFLLEYLLASRFVGPASFVVEPGSNAGNFLAHIKDSVGRVLGVDPAATIAAMANQAGIPTIAQAFGREVAAGIRSEHGPADLVVARHCMAHNETPHEMMAAAASVMANDGVLVIENAYVVDTIENGEFDQVYHEHMFYFSIHSMQTLLKRHGMRLVDVVMSLVHGGSIIFVAARGTSGSVRPSVRRYEARERQTLTSRTFDRFARRAREAREQLRELVDGLVDRSQTIFTYGATAKGNTLLNFTGLTRREIPYCVDSTPMKQGRFLPMSNIEVISEDAAAAHPPDYYLLTAWNYQDEIIGKVRHHGNYDTKFIIPIPYVRIV